MLYILWVLTDVKSHVFTTYRVVHCPKNLLCSVCSSPCSPNHWSFHSLPSFALSRTSYSKNRTGCSLFRLALFTWRSALKVPPWLFMAWQLIPLYCWVTCIIWMDHGSFIHSPTEGCLGCFQVLDIMKKGWHNFFKHPKFLHKIIQCN